MDTIVSDEGYAESLHIETTKPIVVVHPGPGSGQPPVSASYIMNIEGRVAHSNLKPFPYGIYSKTSIIAMRQQIGFKGCKHDRSSHFDAYNTIVVNYNRILNPSLLKDHRKDYWQRIQL